MNEDFDSEQWITITIERYNELLAAEKELQQLVEEGVETWHDYYFAALAYEDEIEEENKQ